MTGNEIKAKLIKKEGSISAVAKRIRKPLAHVSATINYSRLNLAIRRELIKQYGIRFSPNIKPRYSWRPKARRTQRPKIQETV